MVRAPDWTENEFEILLNSYRLSEDELAHRLPRRSSGAIEVVKEGIHGLHTGNDVSMLSRMMLHSLEKRRGSLVCPRCGEQF